MSDTASTVPTSVVTLSANPLVGIRADAGSASAPRTPHVASKVVKRVKSWAWRLSAAYIWLSFAAVVLGQYDRLRRVSGAAVALLISALSRVGFSPTDASYFSAIVKLGWLFAITGFSIIEMVGFSVYVLGFPLGVIVILLGHRMFKNATPNTTPAEAPKKKRLPLLTMAVLALFAWFLLYADSSARHVLVVGVVFAGTCFVLLFLRFFRRVKPIGEEEAALLGTLEVWAVGWMEFGGKFAPSPGKNEVPVYRWMFGWVLRFYRRLALLIRGRRGRDRISIYILLEYALSAIVLAVAAVVFWALAIRAAIAPHFVPMLDSIQVAASHFIPGLSGSPTGPHPPFWLSATAGATAWFLFVIVLAPAGSVLPMRQSAHAARLARSYKTFRTTVRKSRLFLRWLAAVDSRMTAPKKQA